MECEKKLEGTWTLTYWKLKSKLKVSYKNIIFHIEQKQQLKSIINIFNKYFISMNFDFAKMKEFSYM